MPKDVREYCEGKPESKRPAYLDWFEENYPEADLGDLRAKDKVVRYGEADNPGPLFDASGLRKALESCVALDFSTSAECKDYCGILQKCEVPPTYTSPKFQLSAEDYASMLAEIRFLYSYEPKCKATVVKRLLLLAGRVRHQAYQVEGDPPVGKQKVVRYGEADNPGPISDGPSCYWASKTVRYGEADNPGPPRHIKICRCSTCVPERGGRRHPHSVRRKLFTPIESDPDIISWLTDNYDRFLRVLVTDIRLSQRFCPKHRRPVYDDFVLSFDHDAPVQSIDTLETYGVFLSLVERHGRDVVISLMDRERVPIRRTQSSFV
jgi:hypothetical protein